MIRILCVSTSTTVGGAEKTLYSLARGISAEKFSVCAVISLKPAGFYGKKLAQDGIPVVSLNSGRIPSWFALKALKSLIAEHQPDIVHAFLYQAVQLCRLAKGSGNFKLISSPRVTYRTRSAASLALDRVLKSRDDLLICESDASREFLIRNQGYHPAKVVTVYNGIDPEAATIPDSKIMILRKQARVQSGDFFIGSCGRLDAQKNHECLIRALAQIKDRLTWRCVILGEGPKRARLQSLIRRFGLLDRVRLLGERLDMADWASCFDLFVLPSLWEGLPNVLLEAMSAGAPCAASAVDGIPEVVGNGETGFLFPPGDPGALARAIMTAASDKALLKKIGRAGQGFVRGKFLFSSMISNYETIYEALGQNSRG
ncbi:MAG: glycosyltransferase [Elusimicrobiota bacterium]